MAKRIYEVEVCFFEDGDVIEHIDDQTYFNFYFECHPTQNDVLQTIDKQLQYHEYQAGKPSALGYMHKLFTQAQEVVSHIRGGWFDVGVGGGRISNVYHGYVTVDYHDLIDNTASLG